MPVFNAERYLRPAIDSILAQTFSDFEFLIVDDGSTDRSRDIVAAYADPRIAVVDQGRNQGLAAALNRGLQLARGEYVARHDADDVSAAVRLEQQVRFLRDHPDVAVLGTQGFLLDEGGRVTGTVDRSLEHASIRWAALFDNPFIHSSVMFRRGAIASVEGGVEARFDGFCEDYALWSRVLAAHPVRNLAERLVSYRVLATSLTANMHERAPGDPARVTFAAKLRPIIERNLRATLPDADFPETDASLLTGFVLGLDSASIDGFMSLYFRMLERFRVLHPDASRSPDFRRTLARQFDAIACRLLPQTRRLALRVYAEGVRREPSVMAALSWPRALALVILGRAGRRRLGRRGRPRSVFADHT